MRRAIKVTDKLPKPTVKKEPAGEHEPKRQRKEDSDVYLTYRIKRSILQGITKKVIAENPAMQKPLAEYFDQIMSYTHTENSEGRLLSCDEELDKIKEDLKFALKIVTDALEQVNDLRYGRA